MPIQLRINNLPLLNEAIEEPKTRTIATCVGTETTFAKQASTMISSLRGSGLSIAGQRSYCNHIKYCHTCENCIKNPKESCLGDQRLGKERYYRVDMGIGAVPISERYYLGHFLASCTTQTD